MEALQENFKKNIAQFPPVGSLKYEGPVLFVGGTASDYLKYGSSTKFCGDD